MNVLVYLAQRPGEVVSNEALLAAFWRVDVSSPNAVHKSINELRHAFGNKGGEAIYIETVSRRGYRLVAAVSVRDPATANEKPKSIAVLPFRNVTGNPDHDYLADGLVGALLDCLSRVPNLSAMRVGMGAHSIGSETVQEIGRALGVEHLLEGNVLQLNDSLRVSVALYRSSDGECVYTYRDDEPIAKILQIQDKVIANVLSALEIHLDKQRAEDMRNWGTRNVEAYLAAAEAESFRRHFDEKSLRYAAERFRSAIALDPGFLRAYTSLVHTLVGIDLLTFDDGVRRVLRDEIALLQQAVTRLEGNAEALAEIELLQRKLMAKAWPDVEAAARGAIRNEGAPHRAFFGYVEFADLLKNGHLFREAARYLDLFERFEKYNPWVHGRRTELTSLTLGPWRAIPMQRKSLTLFQNSLPGLHSMVARLALIGEFDEAERYLVRLDENDAKGIFAYSARLSLGTLRGDWTLGSEGLRTALDHPLANDHLRAVTYFQLGDVAAGLEAWNKSRQAYIGRWSPTLKFLVNHETFYAPNVVNDSRYQDFLDKIHLGRQWTAYLREKVAELAPITGIEPGDPTPQKVHSR